MLTALTNGTLFTGAKQHKGKALLFTETGILDLVDPGLIPEDAQVVDCEGATISPGLIDLQIYGAGGCLFSDEPSAKGLQTITEAIVKSGTTGFLLTLATNGVPAYRDAVHVLRYHPNPAALGLHFEGPYLNPAKKGAHLDVYMKVPTEDEVKAMTEEAKGILKMLTLAPEVVPASIIQLLAERGVLVSAGHSNASFVEAQQGFAAGIRAVTHLFNAMSPLLHREPGLPGAAALSGASASVIADGIHVDFATVALSKKLFGDHLFLISDAVAPSTGVYPHVETEDRFTLPDGTLSGSKLTLLEAVKNCVQHCGIPLAEALRMASLYPANLLGRKDLGRLETGAKANVLVFDGTFGVKEVYLEGKAQLQQRSF